MIQTNGDGNVKLKGLSQMTSGNWW
ncbi:hypothetical protein [Ralstonia sp. A12]